jgi:hypothetical protein
MLLWHNRAFKAGRCLMLMALAPSRTMQEPLLFVIPAKSARE